MNVNAPVLKQPGFALRVMETLGRHGLVPADLVLEVTETTVFNHASTAITRQLRQLIDAGVHVALDDFGTGYSSLTHLKTLPFNILKIDRSFVKDIGQSMTDRAIIQALIRLGADLGCLTVAEGIENEDDARILSHLGCACGQGYLFRRPQPRAAIDRLLARRADILPESLAPESADA